MIRGYLRPFVDQGCCSDGGSGRGFGLGEDRFLRFAVHG